MSGIRVLLLEDTPTDAELAVAELRRAGLSFELRIEETRDGMLAALEEFRPEVIVSDYSMPAFDGMSALRLALDRARGVPFIVCTGSVAEETVIECMKAGAWDYVLKDRLSRLPVAVRGALDLARTRAERAAAEAARRESEAMTLSIMDSLASSIAVLDRTGRILAVNRAWREFAAANGAAAETIEGVGLDYLDHARRALPEETAARALAGIGAVLEGREPAFSLEYPCHGPGVERWFVLQATRWAAGHPGVVVAHVDVTAMRRMASRLRQWADAFAHCAHGILLVSPDTGRVLGGNPAFARMLGCVPEEVVGRAALSLWGPGDHAKVTSAHAAADRGEPARYEALLLRKDGSAVPVRMAVVTVRDEAGTAIYRVETALADGDRPPEGARKESPR